MKNIYLLAGILLIMQYNTYAQSGYNVYFGNLHSHTGYTGGVMDPAYAFAYAKDTGLLDFLAVTDHLETLSNTEWLNTKNMADAATVNGVFVAFAGYEWTSPNYGHCNVFNTTTKVSQLNVNNWSAFVQDLLANPPVIAQFNHPGFVGSNNWNDFTYLGQTTDNVFRLFEINSSIQELYYPQVLDSGWHVSPTSGQDNHEANWGTMDDTRTGIWAQQLTRTSLIEAINAGRTFCTFDKNASVWIDIAGTPMGSAVSYTNSMPLHIKLNDADMETWKYVYVMAAGNQILYYGQNKPGNFDTIININPSQSKWLYVKARQVDDQYIYSAPMYITNLPTNILETNNKCKLKIYPNPLTTGSKIFIHSTNCVEAHITLFDMTGREILSFNKIVTEGNNTLDITESLQQGFYFLKVGVENYDITHKLFIIK